MSGLALYGILDHFLEPFCYGAAGFLLTYRLANSFSKKVVAILLTMSIFLLFDSVMLAVISRDAGFGISSLDSSLNDAFSQSPQIGESEYITGEKAPLWSIPGVDAWDLFSLVFVVLAFHIGVTVTNNSWHSSRAEFRSSSGPPPIGPRKNSY